MSDWDDYVKNAIVHYPTLYASKSLADSSFEVAHHCFITLGNGMEWTYGNNGMVLRAIGEDTKLRPAQHTAEDFINSEWWELWREEDDICSLNTTIVFKEPVSHGGRVHHHNTKDKSHSKTPYPNFQKQYSKVWKIDDMNSIDPSWRQAMMEHYEYWLDHYKGNDPHCHVGKEREYREVWSKYSVQEVKEKWDVAVWNGKNYQESIQYLREQYAAKCVKYLDESLVRLTSN